MAERKARLGNALKTSKTRGYWLKAQEEPAKFGFRGDLDEARIYAALGEKDKAFEFLEKSFNRRNPAFVWLKVSPEFDNLRSDPRFADLVRRVGIP